MLLGFVGVVPDRFADRLRSRPCRAHRRLDAHQPLQGVQPAARLPPFVLVVPREAVRRFSAVRQPWA